MNNDFPNLHLGLTHSNINNDNAQRPDGAFAPLSPHQRPAGFSGLMGVTQGSQLPPGLHPQGASSHHFQMGLPDCVSYEASLPIPMQQITTGASSSAVAANPANQEITTASYYIAALSSFLPRKNKHELVKLYCKHLDSVVNIEAEKKRKHEAGEEGWAKYQPPEYGVLEKLALTQCLAELAGREGALSIREYDNPALLHGALDHSKEKQGMLMISEAPYAIPLHKSEASGEWLAEKRFPDGTKTNPQALREMLAGLPASVSLGLTLWGAQKKDWPKTNAASAPDALGENQVHEKEYINYLDQMKNPAPRTKQNEPSMSPEFAAATGEEFKKFSLWATINWYTLAACDVGTLKQLIDIYCKKGFPKHEDQEESLPSICLNAYVEWRSARALQKSKEAYAIEVDKVNQKFKEIAKKNQRENSGNDNDALCVVM